MRPPRLAVLPVVLALSAASLAWLGPGHQLATRLAVQALPQDMPAFFRNGADTLVHGCVDPDLYRVRDLPQLRAADGPQHFMDMEYLKGAPLPPTRKEFFDLCAKLNVNPCDVGMLPYAVAEETQRLAVIFAEHRKWPDDPSIQRKALVAAATLAHFAQDLCQPLHTTVHYDGRIVPGGPKPTKGIHLKLDALIQKTPPAEAKAIAVEARVLPDLWAAVLAQLNESHGLVDKVYEMEPAWPALDAPLEPGSPAAAFAAERLRVAASFTASLYATAWRLSEKPLLPDWHTRP